VRIFPAICISGESSFGAALYRGIPANGWLYSGILRELELAVRRRFERFDRMAAPRLLVCPTLP